MVLHKGLDYGFNGYRVPSFPRASRSARGRSLFKRNADNKQMCAFELLATVAGNLLQEGRSSESPSNIADERVRPFIVNEDVDKALEPCDGSELVSDVTFQDHNQNKNVKEPSHPEYDLGSEHSFIVANSSCSEMFDDAEVVTGQESHEFMKLLSKTGGGYPGFGESCGNAVDRIGGQLELETKKDFGNVRNGIMPNECNIEYAMELNVKPPPLISSNGFVKLLRKTEGGSPGYGEQRGSAVDGIERQLNPETEQDISNLKNGTLSKECSLEYLREVDVKLPSQIISNGTIEVPCTSFFPIQTNVKLVCKDDDENFSGCIHPSTGNLKAFRRSPGIGDRRIRRLLAFRYRKAASKLYDRKLSKTGTSRLSLNKKICHRRQKSQRNSTFRGKFFEHRLISRSEKGSYSKGIPRSVNKGTNIYGTGSASSPSLVSAQELPFHSRDSRLKLNVKSLRVPELLFEIPETATVGSLKRTVREAVTSLLAGGLCVGVVVQGEKVRDDTKTLLQTGISCDDKLDALGFMLEPKPTPAPPPPPPPPPPPALAPQPLCQGDSPCHVSYDLPQPLARYPENPAGYLVPPDPSSSPTPIHVGNIVENGLDAVSPPVDLTDEKTALEAPIANTNGVEALAAVPLHRKPSQSELPQRRIRRPFSVSEVEALVQAVEKFGTGRWRDVKLYAFDGANHRTYVDLKDKWKTLVHTAKISPQQRRGEPVPQHLLDRVLAAYAHWSEQQVNQESETRLHVF